MPCEWCGCECSDGVDRTVAMRARMLAIGAHYAIDQRRKYTNEPYLVHPKAVVRLVASVPHTDAMIAAAWLHDVVEDTKVTLDVIRDACSAEVADLVYWLTDKSRPADGNRATRKAIDRAHIAGAPAEAQTIKLADLIDNTLTIEQHDPNFAIVYRKEKARLLEVLTKGDATLLQRARDQLATSRCT